MRFSEFKNNWNEISFSNHVKIISGGTPSTKKSSYWGGNIPWIAIDDFNNEKKYVFQTERTITEEGLNNSSTHLLKKNDLILSARGTVGKVAIIPYEMAFNQSCYGLRTYNELNSHFLYYELFLLQKILKRKSYGSTFETISSKDLKSIKIKIPSLNEQEKITKFLSHLDKKIELMEKKLKNQEIILYSVRYNIFTNISNPMEYKLGEISDIIKGKQLNKENMDDNLPYYVLNGGKSPSGHTDKWNVTENTITISEGGESCGYLNYNTEKFYCGGHCYYLDLKDGINDYYLFNYLKFREQDIMRLRVGSGLPNIQKKDLTNLKIVIHKDNQEKIGKLLQLIVNKISNLKKEIKTYKNFKKSLLSKMLC